MLHSITKGVLVAAAVVLMGGVTATAQDIVQVEEDWELVLGTPNSNRGSPQLTFLMSPVADTNSVYCVFVVNQRTYPQPAAGGLQQQVWNNGALQDIKTFSSVAPLSNSGERVTWTQRMSLNGVNLKYEVVSGSSSTWGKFGKSSELAVQTQVSLLNLNGYDPNVSTANTGIDFGNTRVSKLTLKKVRTYTSSSKSIEQVADRVVYSYP